MKSSKPIVSAMLSGVIFILAACSIVLADRTAEEKKYSKPGFVTIIEEGRLWVFKEGSAELVNFRKDGELAKHVVLPGAGPDRLTLKGPDTETLRQYMAFKQGFTTIFEDERLWVFKNGDKELESFKSHGELAKHVVRPKAGPMGMTVKAPDIETLAAYLAR